MMPSAAKPGFALVRRTGAATGALAAVLLVVAADLPADWVKDVRDDTPLPTKTGNAAEFAAYIRTILRARQTTAEDFAEHVQAGVTGRQMYESERAKYRGQIVRVTGQLKRLQALPVPPELERHGVGQLYEAWIFDQFSFDKPVCVIGTELPPGIKPAEQFNEVYWVTFDGFFFKRLQYQTGGERSLTPLVVGRALRLKEPASNPTSVADSSPALNCPADWLEHVEDDTPVQSAKDNADEYNAYNFFVSRARQVPLESLAKNARHELTFRRLYEAGRSKYRGEIVHVEGRLKRVNWIGSNAALEADGIKDLYEAWIFPEEYFNPTCVVISELPVGLRPAENMQDTWASFDGYFFKRYKYKAADATRLAPLAIGRTLSVKAPPISAANSSMFESYAKYFVPAGIILAVGMVTLIVTISRWFKNGDRVVRSRLEQARTREFVEPQ